MCFLSKEDHSHIHLHSASRQHKCTGSLRNNMNFDIFWILFEGQCVMYTVFCITHLVIFALVGQREACQHELILMHRTRRNIVMVLFNLNRF